MKKVLFRKMKGERGGGEAKIKKNKKKKEGEIRN